MAPKHPPPSKNPPPHSSSEEETDSETEETDTQPPQNDTVSEQHEKEESENEEEEFKSAASPESDNDSDDTVPSPNASDFTVKPIIKNNKPEQKTPTKRVSEFDESPIISNKKKRVGDNNGVEDTPVKRNTGAVQRIWSLDDEVVILEGMVEYKEKKGVDPYSDMVAFHEFIKKSLHIDVSKNQLMDKIRRMKKKFLSNSDKWFLSKPHERRVFEVSKKIWGDDKKISSGNVEGESRKDKGKGGNSSSKRNVSDSVLALPVQEVGEKKEDLHRVRKEKVKKEKARKQEVDSGKEEGFELWMDELIKFGKGLQVDWYDDRFVKEGMKLVGSSQLKELGEKWEKIEKDAMELSLKRLELIQEETKLILDTLNS